MDSGYGSRRSRICCPRPTTTRTLARLILKSCWPAPGPVPQVHQFNQARNSGYRRNNHSPYLLTQMPLQAARDTMLSGGFYGNSGGDTGYQSFAPGNKVYACISNSVTASGLARFPSDPLFSFCGRSVSQANQPRLILMIAAFGNGAPAPGSPAVTNVLQVGTVPIADVTWPTTSGVQYQPESTTNLQTWNTNFPVVTGNGGTGSVLFPLTNNSTFFRSMASRRSLLCLRQVCNKLPRE